MKYIKCYRWTHTSSCDVESVWEFVQRHKGFIKIRSDQVDFFIHENYEALLLLSFGKELTRQAKLDYIE